MLTANIFALMGLRQLYFLIGGLLKRLVYLGIGLAVLLAFIGVKLHPARAARQRAAVHQRRRARPRVRRTSASCSRSASSWASSPSRPSPAWSRRARTTGPRSAADRGGLSGPCSRTVSGPGSRSGGDRSALAGAQHRGRWRPSTQARPTSCGRVRRWPSTTRPASAATAGSRLSSTPKTRALSRRRATSSSEYGSTEDSSAIPAPRQRASQVSRAVPAVASPSGATSQPRRRPSRWPGRPAGRTRVPVRALSRMYAAQQAPAARAAGCRGPRARPRGTVRAAGDEDHPERRAGHGDQVAQPAGQRRSRAPAGRGTRSSRPPRWAGRASEA